jgi:hypothetical protein
MYVKMFIFRSTHARNAAEDKTRWALSCLILSAILAFWSVVASSYFKNYNGLNLFPCNCAYTTGIKAFDSI